MGGGTRDRVRGARKGVRSRERVWRAARRRIFSSTLQKNASPLRVARMLVRVELAGAGSYHRWRHRRSALTPEDVVLWLC